MHFSLPALLTLPLLLPIHALPAIPKSTAICPSCPATYTITNYHEGCSPAACTYRFNLTYSPAPNAASSPFGSAFATYCQGNDIQDALVECADYSDVGVSANVVSEVQGLDVYVQRLLPVKSDGTRDLIEGNQTAVKPGEGSPPRSFEVEVRVYGEVGG